MIIYSHENGVELNFKSFTEILNKFNIILPKRKCRIICGPENRYVARELLQDIRESKKDGNKEIESIYKNIDIDYIIVYTLGHHQWFLTDDISNLEDTITKEEYEEYKRFHNISKELLKYNIDANKLI